jgi:16S rRNA (guanine966-N2)-methyltransferase
MRIVAGQFRGRVLSAPAGSATRPTADRAKEALFNILAHGQPPLDGARVLDAFAGSGALGLEALSRGAGHAVFLEADPTAIAVIRANIRKLGIDDRTTVLRADATRPPKASAPCDLVLMDPPYRSGLAQPALQALSVQGWLAAEARIIVEVAAAEPFASPLEGWAVTDERTYGAARLVFLSRS